MKTIGIGLLGFGTVGQGVLKLLQENATSIAERRGVQLELRAIGVSSLAKSRSIESNLLTEDLDSLVSNPDVQIVLEAMGGLEPARALALSTFENRKPFVTANKALIATHGPELFDAARNNNVECRFESTVCAGVPVIAALDRQLAANRVFRILGIVNGTTNYILTRMTRENMTYEDVLAVAQELGYAEADPSSDVDGHDAAFKIAILGSIASGFHLHPDKVKRQGIREVDPRDILGASSLGGRVRLIAEWRAGEGPGAARVEPVVVLPPSRFVDVESAENAIEIDGDQLGPVFIAGSGAGGSQTASGLVGDVIEVACNLETGPSLPHSWKPSDVRSRWTSSEESYVVFSNANSVDAFERVEKALAPIRVNRFVLGVEESAALTEICDSTLMNDALERDSGKWIRKVYRVIS